MTFIFPLAIVATLGSTMPEVSGIVIDRIVAVVDKEVVTRSELLTEARIALIHEEGPRGVALVGRGLDAELMASMREYVINQLLVANQVRRLGTIDVSDAEVDRALQRFQRAFNTPEAYRAFLRKYDISEEAVRELLRRDLRNDAYVAQRMRLRLGAAALGGERHQQYETVLQGWLAELRKATEIRLIGPSGELERQ